MIFRFKQTVLVLNSAVYACTCIYGHTLMLVSDLRYQVCPLSLPCSAPVQQVTDTWKLYFPVSPVSWVLATLGQWVTLAGCRQKKPWCFLFLSCICGHLPSWLFPFYWFHPSEQKQYISSFHLVTSDGQCLKSFQFRMVNFSDVANLGLLPWLPCNFSCIPSFL